MKVCDLHTHSYYSDGENSPAEVIARAKCKGVKYLALSDHNSVKGVAEAVKEGKKQGIVVIPAVEIRAEEDEVLGYFVDYKNTSFKRDLADIQNNLIERVRKIIQKINQKGIKVNLSDLDNKFPNARNNLMEIHLVKYLAGQGYGTISELWKKYISKEGETFVPIKEISIIEAIKLIKKYGGVPVLAHPWVEESSRNLLEGNNLEKLVKAGLRGIERDNGEISPSRSEKIVQRIEELAKKYNLIITSGSDFHGEYRIGKLGNHEIGNHNCDGSVVKQLREAKCN
jgi:3',5'-nucleoside bisphosphate phosphatase